VALQSDGTTQSVGLLFSLSSSQPPASQSSSGMPMSILE
jgi:hypothetical protein